MEKIKTNNNGLTGALLSIYLVILTWIILFKLQFSLDDLDSFRSINLIPFRESVVINNKIDFAEIYENVIIFIPLGIYVSMLRERCTLFKKIVSIGLVSLCYEVLQFILAIGASDMTDLLGNTIGGIIGIIVYYIFYKLFKTYDKTNKVLNILALISTILIVLILGFLFGING